MAYDQSKIMALRREFHQYPELGFQEQRTKRRISNFMKDLGFEVHEGVGVLGILRAGKGNRAIALRADMDALPIQEESAHQYASKTSGVMHACGHDGHMTMLLGAAQMLSENPSFDGTVVFIFQPNEELGLGAKAMIDEGVLQKFPVDELSLIHISEPTRPY